MDNTIFLPLNLSRAVPIDALFGFDGVGPNPDRDPRSDLRTADVIIGLDWTTQNTFLVYGRAAAARILKTNDPQDMCGIVVGLDQQTDDLERLLAVVTAIKGAHEYVPAPAEIAISPIDDPTRGSGTMGD